jgi:hypothetical protein
MVKEVYVEASGNPDMFEPPKVQGGNIKFVAKNNRLKLGHKEAVKCIKDLKHLEHPIQMFYALKMQMEKTSGGLSSRC